MSARPNPTNVTLGTYPVPGVSITVSKARQGSGLGDAVTRSSDMGLFDTVNNVNVSPEDTNVGTPND